MTLWSKGLPDKFLVSAAQKLDINIGGERINCRFKASRSSPKSVGGAEG